MLHIQIPHADTPKIAAMIDYSVSVIFGRFLNQRFTTEPSRDGRFHITLDGRTLTLPADFFDALDTAPAQALPETVAGLWDSASSPFPVTLIEPTLPVMFGAATLTATPKKIEIGIDIIGSVFFMLSRYEEVPPRNGQPPARDNHDRAPAHASLAYRAGFLDRPIVTEYMELLWAAMGALWPGLSRPKRDSQIYISCDVDSPYCESTQGVGKLARTVARDIIKDKNPLAPLGRLRNYLTSRGGDFSHDPYDCFDWYMNACEAAGRQARFYFITDHSGGRIDGYYDIFEPRIKALMQDMHARGHEMGVHSSYKTYQSQEQTRRERARMIEACARANITTEIKGNRQHFLRWDSAQTPAHLQAAGYDYDTSGSYADRAGFRYGTTWSFPMWDWTSGHAMTLLQRPLALMECSVIAPRYMGMGYTEAALSTMQEIKKRALAFDGDFTLLWHNSHFQTPDDARFFTELIT